MDKVSALPTNLQRTFASKPNFDSPVNESPLGVEQIELAVETGPCGSDGGGVGKHTERSRDLCQISSGNVGRRLVTDTELEPGRAPVNELNGSLGLDLSDGRVDVLGDDVSSVEKSASHVFTLTRIAFDPEFSFEVFKSGSAIPDACNDRLTFGCWARSKSE